MEIICRTIHQTQQPNVETSTCYVGRKILFLSVDQLFTHHALRIDHLGERVREVLQRDLARVVDVLEELDVRHVPLLVEQVVEPREVLNCRSNSSQNDTMIWCNLKFSSSTG